MSVSSSYVTPPPPPSTGKKVLSRRVFGDAVLDEMETTSLCYSLSEEDTVPGSPQVSTPDRSSTAHSMGDFSGGGSGRSCDSSSGSATSQLTGVMERDGKQETLSFPASSSSMDANDVTFTEVNHGMNMNDSVHSGQSAATRGPFDKLMTPEKENANNNKLVYIPSERSTRLQAKLRKMRAKTPLKRDLVKATQDAINMATMSVKRSLRGPINPSIQAVGKSKVEQLRWQKKVASKLQKEWKDDSEQAKVISQQMEKNRREMLTLRRNLYSMVSREKAMREKASRAKQLQEIEQEVEFKSIKYREATKNLQEEEERYRRSSIEARAKLRENHREGQQKLDMKRIEEEKQLFEERYDTSVAIRNERKENVVKKRKSYVFRNGDARRIRQLYAQMQADRLMEDHLSFELKWMGEKDAQEYKDRLEKERRESLAARNDAGRKLRLQQVAQRKTDWEAEHKSYLLKWDGQKDAEKYKEHLQEIRRASLVFRGRRAVHQREQESAIRSKELALEHESYELKWAGEQDAADYRDRLAAEKRCSLAERGKKFLQEKNAEEIKKSEAMAREHEAYQLKWESERDAREYVEDMEKARRESLAFRNHWAKCQRDLVRKMDSEKRFEEHASYQLKWEGERDVELYKKESAEQRRISLAERNKERARHAKVMEELATIAREKETESLVLKWAGDKDAEKYLEKIAQDRRESLKQRGKQKQRERLIKIQLQHDELQRRQKDEEMRAADQKDIEEYRNRCAERDRASLEYRLKEARAQRLEEVEGDAQSKEIDRKNFKLDSEARTDMERYLDECKRRRRLSLAFRAKEKRKHAKWKMMCDESQRSEQSRNARIRLLDQRHTELALQQEQSLQVLEAIRHLGCTFNPSLK